MDFDLRKISEQLQANTQAIAQLVMAFKEWQAKVTRQTPISVPMSIVDAAVAASLSYDTINDAIRPASCRPLRSGVFTSPSPLDLADWLESKKGSASPVPPHSKLGVNVSKHHK